MSKQLRVVGVEPADYTTTVPFKTPFFYGWVIVIIGAISQYFSGPGQTYGVSVFTDAYIRNLGLSRTDVSGLYSMATLISGFSLFFVGKLLDKLGSRTMTVAAAVGLGLATLGCSFVAGPVGLFIGFFFLRIFGQGSLTLIPSTLLPQWFIKHRGRALSIMAIGGLASGATVPLLNNWLIETWNWHLAWRVWSVILILLFAPAAYYLIRNKPEHVGLLPDGEVAAKIQMDPRNSRNGASIQDEVSWTLKEAAKTPVFWFVLYCAFEPAMVGTGITFNFFSILETHGLDRNFAAMMLSLVPLIGFASAIIAGLITDKVKPNHILVVTFLFKFLELVILYFAHSIAGIFIFVLSWGLSQGLMNIAIRLIWPNYFGRKHLGSINSVYMMCTVVGSAFGPVPFGYAFDYFGSYQQILLMMMILPILAMALAFISKKPIKSDMRA